MKKIKKILSLGLMIALVSATAVSADFTPVKSNFTDVTGHWSEIKVQEAINTQIITNDTSFRPDDAITRYEFAGMINNALKQKQISDKTFTDLEKGSVKETEMLKAVANGYIVGYSDNTVRPDNNLIRQEAATMAATALKLEDNQEASKMYLDNDTIDEYAKGKVGAASLVKIMGGNPDGSFAPMGNLTRAEGLVIALNVAAITTPDVVIEKDGTILENQTIEGNLVISDQLGSGSATLNNVTVLGKTEIKGGGKNSIHIINSQLSEVVVSDNRNEVRVSFEGTTNVTQVTMNSGALLEASKTFTGIIDKVAISNEVAAGGATAAPAEIKISVPVKKVEIAGDATIKTSINSVVGTVVVKAVTNAQGQIKEVAVPPVLNISKEGVVGKVVADSKTEIQGTGTIKEMEVNVGGITTEIKPDKIVTAPEVAVPPVVEPPKPIVPDKPDKPAPVITYDETVTSGKIHLEDGNSVVATASKGVMSFDLSQNSGTITGITLVSTSNNTYTVTNVKSPKKEKIASWTCKTKDLQSMSIFIDYAKTALGFGGGTNADKMPISVIKNWGGAGTYKVEGKINNKTLVININL